MKITIEPGLIKRIVGGLTPDLLKGFKYNPRNPLRGHCYVASEALFYCMRGCRDTRDKPIFCPQVASYGRGGTHWWIVDTSSGTIYDLTAGQFKNSFLRRLYAKGRFTGFLTKEPSKRAKVLLQKIGCMN